MTYLDYKKKIEFDESEYKIIDDYCKKKIFCGSVVYGISILSTS